MWNISSEVILREFSIKINVIMDVHLYINPITWSRTWFCIEWSFPNGDILRTGMQNMKESGGRSNTGRYPYCTPDIVYIPIKSAQLFRVRGLIVTSKECIHGIISICVSVCIQVFGWSSKTHFELQRGVKLYKQISNLFFRYLEGRSRLYEHHV